MRTTIHIIRLSLVLSIALAALPVFVAAQPYDFTWDTWGGDPAHPQWGGAWTFNAVTYYNGWGLSYEWWEDPTPYYPALDSDVLIPDGALVLVGGNPSLISCGTLTLESTATLEIPYNTLPIAGPTLVNQGLIRMTRYTATLGTIDLRGDLAISGDGAVEMYGGSIAGLWTIYELTVGEGQQIRGDGQLGNPNYGGSYHPVDLVNNGRIRAFNTGLSLLINGNTVTNRDLVVAEQGGILELRGDWDNIGGVISATDASRVSLDGGPDTRAHVTGGTLETTGSGWIQLSGQSVVEDVTLDGLAVVNRYDSGHLRGTLTNDGNLEVGAGGGAGEAALVLDSDVTIDGVGTIVVGEGNPVHLVENPPETYRFTLGEGQTLRLEGGRLGTTPGAYGDRRLELASAGTIVADGAINNPRFNLAGTGFTNTGRLEVVTGSLEAWIYGAFEQGGGLTLVDGSLRFWDATALFTGGGLSGDGTVTGTVELGTAARLSPGGSTGTLTVAGDLALNDGAELLWEIDDTSQDLVTVTGHLSLDGTIQLTVGNLTSAGIPTGDYVLMTYDTITDQATWQIDLPGGWTSGSVVVADHQVVLTALDGPTAVPGPQSPVLALRDAAPNPFNPSTRIHFDLGRDMFVRLDVFDVSGRLVRSLVKEMRPAGRHEVAWQGRDEAGRSLASGVYYACLAGDGQRDVISLVLVR